MTEDEAIAWIARHHGSAGMAGMKKIVDLVSAAATQQNLIAASTVDTIWARHIVDSSQLLNFVASQNRTGVWVDVGSGAGFPGLVIAALSGYLVWLVEPRARRVGFLQEAVAALALENRVQIVGDRVQALSGVSADVISARAVAPLATLLGWAQGCATPDTQWIIPKGRTAREDVAKARETWHGVFHVEHSITDPQSLIVLASGVARR